MEMTMEQLNDAAEFLEMYCPDCDDVVGDRVEPDARGCVCPVCGGQRGMGAEEAVLEGYIEIV
jgi:hypothetical protein